jgi:hypothetical protein
MMAAAIVIAGCGSSGSSTGGNTVGPQGGDDGGTTTTSDGGVTTTSDSVTLTMGPFDVPAGQEVFICQDFANPFGGADQDIIKYEEHMTAGSHHMFLFFMGGATNGNMMNCPSGGFEFHPYPLTAGTPDYVQTYPDGVGSMVPANMGFRVNAHYVNPSASAIKGTVTVTLHKAPAGSVQQHAGVVFMNQVALTVPPGVSTQTRTCTLPAGLNIMQTASHMHQRATNFVATTQDGTMLYQTDQWADPKPRLFTPPMALSKSTDVTWSCTYNNDTGQTLTFGEFASTNVMCIFEAQYYPVADPHNPLIECQKP